MAVFQSNGLACFFNKCALLKSTLKVNNDLYTITTNLFVPKLHFVPYNVKQILATPHCNIHRKQRTSPIGLLYKLYHQNFSL